MPKTIDVTLIQAKAEPVALISRKLRIGPLIDGTYIRWTSIDKDERYDFGAGIGADGEGEQVYLASTGMQMTTIEATNDLSVDNAEVQSLVPVHPMPGITDEMVITGKLDTVPYIVIETVVGAAAGKHEVMASGVIGKCRIEQGVVAIPELLSWSQLLAQTGIISQTSLDCRAKHFGSQPGDEREYCGYAVEGEWRDFIVTAVGSETVREFTIDADSSSGLEFVDDYYTPGLVEMYDGDNAGRSREVESFADTGAVSLRFTFPKPMQVGDRGRIRRDCTRMWTGHNSCDTYSNRPMFRGEPKINIGDSNANAIPGVNSVVSTGGTGE